jgi:hypothetical protein
MAQTEKVKVKLLVGLAGATNKDPGHEHECSKAEAKRLIKSGAAEAIAGQVYETARRPAPTTRTTDTK